ncbi:MAG TPA: hypothetical protein VI072_10890 [Polyangiaceae bacterium]
MHRRLSILLPATLTLVLWAFQGCSGATPPPPTDPSEGAEPPVTPPPPEPPPPLPEGPLLSADAAAPTAPTASGPVSNACSKDDDCVPASCCHSSACVARGQAPDCKATMCTMECRPATLDCGGSCLCQNGQCAAKLNDLGRAN